MTLNVDQEMAALRRLPMRELRARFAELFAETTPAGNRLWLMRRHPRGGRGAGGCRTDCSRCVGRSRPAGRRRPWSPPRRTR